MTEKLRLQLTADRVIEELSKWAATCPYDGLEEHLTDEALQEWANDIAEQIRDDWGDSQMEEQRSRE